MLQLLKCNRCERLVMIDLGLPADLCGRCLRDLDLPRAPSLTDTDMEILENADFKVDLDGLSWKKAVEQARLEVAS